MPGLTLNTEAVTASAAATPQTPAHPTSSTTYPAAQQPSSRNSSPTRPTYSPITPPLNPTALPPRPEYTHSTHKDQVALPTAPRPEPIDFDSNPDVLALKSAIAILQIQRSKAQRDMGQLDRVKRAAIADPEAFTRDITTGRVRVEGDGLFVGGVRTDDDSSSSEDSEEESDHDGAADTKMESGNGDRGEASATSKVTTDVNMSSAQSGMDTNGSAPRTTDPQNQINPPREAKPANKPSDRTAGDNPRPWATLPKPQNIVRCPPINWSQYAVVGESLDKLHNEQVLRPAQGQPAVVGADGRFEFKGDGVGRQERYTGVAAPYAPGKDRLDKDSSRKGKGAAGKR
ncbi:hypothetical protein F4778DRAFT_116219 [Xylariomycetidae sp. FL2044]|nr:hypothetical protein F4778DRAFT_116219 [Xylariomycetidae sp. FL2044]